MFNTRLTANILRNLPVKKIVNRLSFHRIMVTSLWSRFWPTLYSSSSLLGRIAVVPYCGLFLQTEQLLSIVVRLFVGRDRDSVIRAKAAGPIDTPIGK